MDDRNRRTAAFLFIVWPLCLVFGPIFVALKLAIPRIDWGVAVSGVLMLVLGVQLYFARKKLLRG